MLVFKKIQNLLTLKHLKGFLDIERSYITRIMVSKGSRVETIVYADSDHAGDFLDYKSISSVCTLYDVA